MKMRALDQLHVSSVSSNTMPEGTEFECSKPLAEELEKKGLAERVAEPAAEAPKAEVPASGKAEEAPANKAEKPPLNKSASRKRG